MGDQAKRKLVGDCLEEEVEIDMITEISVYLPNIPGQFSKVLVVLADEGVNIRGFSIDRTGALSQLRLLPTDATEAERAEGALVRYGYKPISTELLLLSRPDTPEGLLSVTDVLAASNINVEYGYVVLGQTETEEVLLVLKVEEGKTALALACLAHRGITDYDRVDPATVPLPSAS